MVGGVVFVIGTGMIAAMGEDEAGVMIIMLVAMWLLFIMFPGQKELQAFFGFFKSGTPATTSTTGTTGSSGTPSTTTTGSSGNKPPQAK